jgi:hypothetical protein
VTGAEEEDDIGGQLLVRELVSVLLGLNQLRGEIVARLTPAQIEQPAEILGHGEIDGILLRDFGIGERRQIEQTPALARAGEEDFALLFRDAEHVADHGDGQPESDR